MTITDFYKKNKICVSKWTACLLEPLEIAIKIEDDNSDMQSEIFVHVPASFCINEYFSKNDFGPKAEEANILFSFLTKNERQVKEEFGMDDRKFHMLLAKLEVVLIENYAICNWFRKNWKLVWAYLGLFESFLMGE